ncbi:FGGY family carbohydrate kinase [Lysobacter niabensis]|uniref:FGGY family carbohydrate kinase n=1 Tax=Agrilutibacter niabensis TaxID=380628 RepID=UPI003608A731
MSLALDQGGSASRALVFDGEGRELAAARIEVADHRPRPGWVEQDPEAVVDSLRQAAAAALLQLDAAQRGSLQACGLSCQRSSLVCWDRGSGAALSPILSWQDTRAADWLAAQALDAEAVRASTGLYPNAHFGLSKIRWCLDHLDEVKRAAADGRLVIGSLAAFLAFRLLDQRPCLVDPANASRTLLFDLARGNWNHELLERFAIDPGWLPGIARSDAEFGDLVVPNDTSSQRLPLRLLSGDQSTAAFAYGEPRSDAAYLNVGTGAFVHRLAAQAPAGSRLLRSVIHWSDSPQYVVEGTVNGAGSALAWFAGQHGIAHIATTLDEQWTDDAPGDAVFLNGIGGLGSPDWRPRFASRFIGEATRQQQLAAVAESIVFLIQRNLGLLQGIGEPCAHVLVSGGLSHSDRFCQALADLSQLPLRRPAQCEATARGTAFLLAGRPAHWARLPEQRFEPRRNPALLARYRRWSDCMAAALLER